MSTSTTSVGLWRLAGSQVERWRQPLFRSGHLLVVSSALTAVVGVGYWLVAARRYSPDVVGRNAAAIAAMQFIAGCAQLNLMSALVRFIPTSGTHAPSMIRRAYLVGAGLALVAGAVFAFGAPRWAHELAPVVHDGAAAPVWFALTTGCAAIFVMQDSILVAIGRASVVPIENFCFAALKVLLAAVLAVAASGTGIWLSWSVALVVAVVVTTAYLARSAVPRFIQLETARTEAVTLRDIVRFAGPDYVGAMSWIASTTLVPVLVLGMAGPTAAAAFALPWSICLAGLQVPAAFGQSLVAASAREPDRLAAHYRQLRRHTLLLLAPVVAIVVVEGHWLLEQFGDLYEDEGATTLRLLMLAILPYAVVTMAVSRARVERRTGEGAAYLVATGVIVVGLALLLVPRIGIEGAGIGWLVAETSLAAVVLAREIRPVNRAPRRSQVAAAVARLPHAAAVEGVLPSRSDTTVVLLSDGVLQTSRTERGAAALEREHDILGRLAVDPRLGDWRPLVPHVVLVGDRYLLTTRLPGTTHAIPTPEQSATAVETIRRLHRRTGQMVRLDPGWLDATVDPAAATLGDVLHAAGARRSVDRVAAQIRDALGERRAWVGWTHGDFHPGNVLFDGVRVSGIVDWDQAREHGLTALDLVLWLLTATPEGGELGARVVQRLRRPCCWSAVEAELLGDPDPAVGRALLLLGWLRHVAGNLDKSERYAASPLWLRRNALPVLRQVGR